ncbi:MAG: histidine--tRNA ligase [Mycoplasmataceae bacterium]|nr:histidine--tRNA ligase [Mycoplasmataceae bacterium]
MSNIQYQKPRGTIDYFGSELDNLKYIEDTIKHLAFLYGYSEIRTPIFEHTEVFIRSVGQSSDIVTKEIYNFKDKGGRDITLRPEGTAGVIRAINENKLLQKQNWPLRVYYYGPIFRYERPQSGRARQFHQFGFEILNTNNIFDDVDVILLAYSVLNKLNLNKYHLDINCIGSIQTRIKWIEALKKYFANYKEKLSLDSQNRLQTNPLRILDDKIDSQKDFVKNAPSIKEFLSQEEIDNFNKIKGSLDALNIPYTENLSLVRGLDYYTDLVFEFVSDLEELNGQSTFCGGGRYNNLIQELGGINAQAVGFAFGLERILIQYLTENKQNENLHKKQYDLVLINLLEDEFSSLAIAYKLRNFGFSLYFEPSIKKLNQGFKLAEYYQAKFILILGTKEIENEEVIVKNQITMQQELVKLEDLYKYLSKKVNG